MILVLKNNNVGMQLIREAHLLDRQWKKNEETTRIITVAPKRTVCLFLDIDAVAWYLTPNSARDNGIVGSALVVQTSIVSERKQTDERGVHAIGFVICKFYNKHL